MEQAYIELLIEATRQVLGMMAQIEVTADRHFTKQGEQAHGDMTGIIGLSGRSMHGSIALTFSESLILQVTHNMLGEKQAELNDTVGDVAGEITNMVSGSANNRFYELGHNMSMSTPTVVIGHDHRVQHHSGGQIVVVPFDSAYGRLYLEGCFEVRSDNG